MTTLYQELNPTDSEMQSYQITNGIFHGDQNKNFPTHALRPLETRTAQAVLREKRKID